MTRSNVSLYTCTIDVETTPGLDCYTRILGQTTTLTQMCYP